MNTISLLNSQILDALSEHIAVIDREGNIIYTNQAWESFTNKNLPRVSIGTNYLTLIKKADNFKENSIEVYNNVVDVINREKEFYYIDYPLYSSKKEKWYTMRVSPIGDDGNVIISNANITERVLMEAKLRKNESRISKLLDSASEGILTINNKGVITLINDATCTMFGYSKEELIGDSLGKLMPLMNRNSHHAHVDSFFSNSFLREMGNGKMEINGLRKNGEIFPIGVSLSSFELENEQLAVAFVSDLTEINEAKTEIQQQADLLVKTSEMAKVGSWQWNINDNTVIWDNVLHQIFETKKGFEPSFEEYMMCIEEGEVETVKSSIYKALEEKNVFENSYKITSYKGNVKHLKTWGKVEVDKQGEAVRMLGVCMDVTNQIKKEEELQGINEKLNVVIKGTNTGLWEWDLVTNAVQFNEEWGLQLGYKYDELVQNFSMWEKLVHPADIDEATKRIEAYLKGERKDYEFVHRMKHKDGEWKHILTKGVISKRAEDGTPLYFIGTHTDVNKEEQYLQEISEYERYFSVSMDLMCIANTEGYFVKINPKFTEVLGYSENDLVSQPFTNFIHIDDIEATNKELERLAQGEKTIGFTNRYRCKNGEYKTFIWTASPDSETGLLYAAARDITERVNQETELKNTRNRLENIVDYANVGIAYANKATEVVKANNKFAKILEYDSADEIIGMTVKDFTFPDDLDLDLRMLQEINEGTRDAFEIEKRYVTKNKTIKWVELNVSAVRNGSGEVENYIAMVIDITEKKQKEEIINVLTLLSATHGGKAYFNQLSNSLSKLLKVKYALVGLYNSESREVETVGFSIDGMSQENFTYSIANSPSNVALSGEIEIVESRVQEHYPQDLDLVDMNAESYVGITLFNGNRPIGIIALLDEESLRNSDFIVSVLKQVKTRTETEIRRTKVEGLIIEREARFRGMIEHSSEITCLIDEKGVVKYVAPSITKILNYSVEELLGKKIFNYLHEDDREKAIERIKHRYEEDSSGVYDVYRLKEKGGGYRSFRAIISNHFNTEGINGFIINAQDISELIIAENERYRIALHTEEKERKRLSQDLHDGLGQTIAAASLYMNTLDDLMEDQLDSETYEIFTAGKDLVNKSAKETRMVSHNIMPPSLNHFGLSDSLSEMISNYQKIKYDVDITFKSNIRKHRFKHEVELSLYRVVQELVNNALKHSKAKRIEVSVLIERDKCKIRVKDDGVGFDYDFIKRDKKSGIGLRNIEQRVHVLGGKFEIAKPEKGVEFIITLKM